MAATLIFSFHAFFMEDKWRGLGANQTNRLAGAGRQTSGNMRGRGGKPYRKCQHRRPTCERSSAPAGKIRTVGFETLELPDTSGKKIGWLHILIWSDEIW